MTPPDLSRRDLIYLTASGGLLGLGAPGSNAEAESQQAQARPEKRSVELTVNGERREFQIAPSVTLLDALREHLELTGTKKGCDHGQCGSCTVLVGGRRVLACLILAISEHQGEPIETIEGLARDDGVHPLQAAFVAHDALQCGYCTPGQIMSAIGLLREGRPADDDAIREGMAGNICRCGAYEGIVAAIRSISAGGVE